MNSLDEFFGERPEEIEPKTLKEEHDQWMKRYNSEGPSVWRKKRNPITRTLAETIQQDTWIDLGSPAGTNLWKVAADLCTDFCGDLELINSALEKLRRTSFWKDGVSPYQLRYHVRNEASRMNGKARFKVDPDSEEERQKYLKWVE